jgi:hypothetical protein
MTFEAKWHKASDGAEWYLSPDGNWVIWKNKPPTAANEAHRGLLFELADREERIRTLEAQVEAALSEPPNPAQWVPRSELQQMQARIERVRGLAAEMQNAGKSRRCMHVWEAGDVIALSDVENWADELLAALDGEPK